MKTVGNYSNYPETPNSSQNPIKLAKMNKNIDLLVKMCYNKGVENLTILQNTDLFL